MSLLGTIVSTIFHHANTAPTPPSGTAAAPTAPTHETSAAPPKAAAPAPSSPAPASAPTTTPSEPVDVEAVLTKLAAGHHQHLDWRHSIVDLLKVLNLDSSLAARKQLAAELHYTGDTNDSAKMNIWLHKEVIAELEKNGGKVPDELKH